MARAALGGGSGKGVLLVLFATATIAVPYFWKHRLAPLAFTVPLAVHRHGVLAALRAAPAAAGGDGGDGRVRPGDVADGRADGRETSAFDVIGIGAWLLVATVIFLAFKGITRCLARSQPAVTSSSAS